MIVAQLREPLAPTSKGAIVSVDAGAWDTAEDESFRAVARATRPHIAPVCDDFFSVAEQLSPLQAAGAKGTEPALARRHKKATGAHPRAW